MKWKDTITKSLHKVILYFIFIEILQPKPLIINFMDKETPQPQIKTIQRIY